MKFVCYTDLNQLPEGADVLFAQGEKASLFFSRPWFESLAATALEDTQEMLLACVVAEGNVLAILPMVKCAGNTLYPLRHRYTSLYSLLLAENDQPQILSCLVQGLNQLPFQGLIFEPVGDDDSKINSLQQAMESAGFECHRNFRFYNWILRVQGQSYEEYMATRPARLRNTIARKQRKLEREQSYGLRLFTGEEVPQAMSDYHAVYRASWKAHEQFAGFLDDMVARFSMLGWSRLAVLYINGQPAAAQIWFVLHGKANIFRLAYDETWKQYSPGSILTNFLMEYVIDTDEVEEVDFLTGNEAYKQDWMSERRERWALTCVKSVKPTGRFNQFVEALKGISYT